MYEQPYQREADNADLDTLCERYGLPKPCERMSTTAIPPLKAPVVHAEIDLDEPALEVRTTKRRPGIPVPPMTPEQRKRMPNPEPLGLL